MLDDAANAEDRFAVDGGTGRRFGHAATPVAERHHNQYMLHFTQGAVLSPTEFPIHGQTEDDGFDPDNSWVFGRVGGRGKGSKLGAHRLAPVSLVGCV